jgi:hypothetical protein
MSWVFTSEQGRAYPGRLNLPIPAQLNKNALSRTLQRRQLSWRGVQYA